MVNRVIERVKAIEGKRDGYYCYQRLCEVAEFIETQFQNRGFVVERDCFTFRRRQYWNLIATSNGFHSKQEWTLIGAHYDAVMDSPGADDNASGVAVMLEIADSLGPRQGLVFVAFTLEEPQPFAGHFLIGSRNFVQRATEQGHAFKAVFILESVGYIDSREGSQIKPPFVKGPSTGDFLAVVGDLNSSELIRLYEEAARETGLKTFPYKARFRGHLLPETRFSDHAPFWDKGFPALMLTDTAMFRNPYYHTSEDTSDKLNPTFMSLVKETTERCVKKLLKLNSQIRK